MDRVELLDFLYDSFDDNELRDLCFRLNINYEDLGGDTHAAKTCERHD